MSDGSGARAASAWLERLEGALSKGDPRAAGELFAAHGLWRDLVAFTWNLKTVEGPDGVAGLVAATGGSTRPRGWRVVGEPVTVDGVTEAWIAFETATGRGTGGSTPGAAAAFGRSSFFVGKILSVCHENWRGAALGLAGAGVLAAPGVPAATGATAPGVAAAGVLGTPTAPLGTTPLGPGVPGLGVLGVHGL